MQRPEYRTGAGARQPEETQRGGWSLQMNLLARWNFKEGGRGGKWPVMGWRGLGLFILDEEQWRSSSSCEDSFIE